MPALTPTFVMNLESRMAVITEREYERLRSNLWWQKLVKVRGSTGLRDIIMWLLSTAQIRPQDSGGNIAFDDLVSQYTTIENKFAGAALKLQRRQLEDTDGGGMELSSQWAADIGAYMAYWPQKETAYALRNGHDATKFTTYDKKAFFATDHPLNPFHTAAGSFSNLIGAVPIDDSVTADVALANLSKVVATIAAIRMPNGSDPRFLRPATLLVPPRMFPRAVQLTSAKFIAQAAAAGGGGNSPAGSADVEGFIKALGFATPIQADELAGFEEDKTYFVACETLAASQLGGLIYTEREPFKINYYGTVDESILGRSQELEWQCIGRNVISAGHPYLIFKCTAT